MCSKLGISLNVTFRSHDLSCMYTHIELLKTKAIGPCCQLITIHYRLMTSRKKISDLGFVLFFFFFLVEREVNFLIVLLE